MVKKEKKSEYLEMSAVEYYNDKQSSHCMEMIDSILGNKVRRISGTDIFKVKKNRLTYSDGFFICDGENNIGLTPNHKYSPFMMLSKIKFKGNHKAAMSYVDREFLGGDFPFIRVGVDYFKIISVVDRFKIKRTERKRWRKDEIIQDHGKESIFLIPHFDTFTNEPDNVTYKADLGNMYNLYYEFSHTPKKGGWPKTKDFLKHVFGDQYDLGIKYMQALYQHPKKAAPILVLASKVRATGKSTFLDWMSVLFGGNTSIISPDELVSSFNSSYAFSTVIGIEETVTENKALVEKIKGLSTGKMINLNQKFIDNAKIPFFGKFIITTNEPEKFMKVDSKEVRFWIREIDEIKKEKLNTFLEDDLIKETPAFLDYLSSLPELDYSKSRMLFTAEEIRNKSLDRVKDESVTYVSKQLRMHIEYYFSSNAGVTELRMHPKEIKDEFFSKDRVGMDYINTVIKDEFDMEKEKLRYVPLHDTHSVQRRAYRFMRKDFISAEDDVYIEDDEISKPRKFPWEMPLR